MIGLENPLHIALILIVVLMVFGAKRLPEMGKSLGSGLRGFKQSLSGEEPLEPVHQLPVDHAPQRIDERVA
ncbi:MAG TPA: twin-arginine translocase TatA/TatE family subunit [Solirubrobacteraceae bacterium]